MCVVVCLKAKRAQPRQGVGIKGAHGRISLVEGTFGVKPRTSRCWPAATDVEHRDFAVL